MAWGAVQAKFAHQGAGSSLALALDSNVASGNRLVVWVYVYGAGVTLSQVADSLGNGGATPGVYDIALTQVDPFNGKLYCCTAPITTGGACTVTATASGTAAFMSMWIGERSGLSAATGSAAWDVTASNDGTIATSMASGTTTAVGAAGEMASAAIGDTDLGGIFPLTSPAGWTEVQNNTAAPGANIPMVVDEQTPSNGATVSATWTTASSDAGNGWAAGVVVFKLAATGSTLDLAAAGGSTSAGSAAIGAIDPLSASGGSASSGSAAIGAVDPLAAAGGSVSSGLAAIGAVDTLSASGGSQSSGAATIGTLAALAASGGSTSVGSADLAIVQVLDLAAAGGSSSSGSAAVGILAALSAAGGSVSAGAAALVALAALSASGGSTSTGSAVLWLIATLAAAGGAQSAGSAALIATRLLAAAGGAHSAGYASIDVPGAVTQLRHRVRSSRRGKVAVSTTVQGQ